VFFLPFGRAKVGARAKRLGRLSLALIFARPKSEKCLKVYGNGSLITGVNGEGVGELESGREMGNWGLG